MVNIMIVSHHTLAQSLVDTLEMISGQSVEDRFHAISLKAGTGMDVYQKELDDFLDQNTSDLLVLCDLGYGSPISSLYIKLCEKKIKHKIVSGVNLAMLLVAYTNIHKDLDTLADLIMEEAKASIDLCFEKLNVNHDDE